MAAQRTDRAVSDHVQLACMLAYVGFALALAFWLFVAVLYIAYVPFFAAAAVGVGAAAPAVVLIRFTQRGRQWARIGLTVLGGLVVAGGVVPVFFGIPVGIPPAAYTLVWVSLLWWGPASWRLAS